MSKRNKLVMICAAGLMAVPAFAQIKPGTMAMKPMVPPQSSSAPMFSASTAQPQPVVSSPSSNPARTTLEQMAAYARQAQQAASLAKLAPAHAASAPNPMTPPIGPANYGPVSYPPMPHAGGPGRSASDADSAPRLVSIMGTPGHEQAQIALNGYIYTVSTHSPAIGDSHWTLARIDVPAHAVLLHKEAGKKGEKAKDVLLGFAVRDPETPVMVGTSGIPGAMMPPAPFAGGMR